MTDTATLEHKSPQPGSMQRPERGSALFKALAVLEAVFRHERPASLAEISTELALPRQTVHRVLQQLEANGLLLRDATGERYVVGPGMTRLALEALAASRQTGPGHAVLEALVADVGETCNLGVLDGHEVIYVDRVECDWPLRMQLQAGSRVPVHCTSIGKLLLAYLGRAQRRRLLTAAPLVRYTEHTVTDPETLEDMLAKVRKDGYAASRQEYTTGMVSLAVPVGGESGRPLAALGLHAPEVRVSSEQVLSYLPRLRAAAEKLAEIWIDGGNTADSG